MPSITRSRQPQSNAWPAGSRGRYCSGPCERSALFLNFRAAVSKLTPISDNYRYLRADGGLAWLQVDWFPIRNERGGLSRIQGFAREVTQQLRRAKENESFMGLALANQAGGVIIEIQDGAKQVVGAVGRFANELQ